MALLRTSIPARKVKWPPPLATRPRSPAQSNAGAIPRGGKPAVPNSRRSARSSASRKMRGRHSRWSRDDLPDRRRSIRQLVHPESAAAEIERGAFALDAASKRRGDEIFAPLTHGAEIHDSGVFEHAEVFGRIVLRNAEPVGELVHAEVGFEQRLDDPLPGAVG